MSVRRWVSDEPQPGWVEVEFVDAHGEVWLFNDKAPIFESEGTPIRPDSSYPIAIAMPVTVLERREDTAGPIAVVALPWGIDYESAQDRFEVRVGKLVDAG